MPVYEVFDYELWGNKKDGFEVNTTYSHGDFGIAEDCSDKELIEGLKKHLGFKQGLPVKNFNVSGDERFIIVEYYSRRMGFVPVCHLIKKEKANGSNNG